MLVEHAAPDKPKLEVIVLMPGDYDQMHNHSPCYLCVDYEAGSAVIKIRTSMPYLLKEYQWSYLFQAQTIGRMWDDLGLWKN